jgi:hypothetical protein
MTAAKIAITLAPAQLAKARAAVRSGRVGSVSAYIARAIARQEREDSLDALVRELVEQHGEPSSKDRAWAKRVIKRRKRA